MTKMGRSGTNSHDTVGNPCGCERPEIASIIPGEIRKVRKARGPVKIRVTIPTKTGWKGIALASGARQELFINTKLTKEQVEAAITAALERA